MSKHVTYREYTISSTPLHLFERDEWKPEIVISSEREGIVTSRPYADETTYQRKRQLITMGSSWAKILSTERPRNYRGITMRTNLLKHEHHFSGFRVRPFPALKWPLLRRRRLSERCYSN